MVFVAELFLTSIVVMLALTAGSVVLRNAFSYMRSPLTPYYIQSVYFAENTNILYCSILISMALLNISTVLYLILPVIVVMSFTQPWVWEYAIEAKLVSMLYAIRRISLKRLLDEGCIITHRTIASYIKDIIKSEIGYFGVMIKDSINDIRVVLGLYEPTEEMYELLDQLYEKHRKMFKYRKFERNKNADHYESDEEFMKIYEGYKKNKDPRVAFNRLRRLPIYFVYTEDSNIFFKFFLQNVLVFYNFFKTTLLAVSLALIYFIYTVFFFKIQFLKQLSVWFVIGMLYF